MNNEVSELEFISTSNPSNDFDSTSHESEKLILTNAVGTGKASKFVSIDPAIILAQIVEHTSGWPKCAAGQLIVKSVGGAVRFIKNDTELFAWLHEFFDVLWRANPAVSPKVFFESLETMLSSSTASRATLTFHPSTASCMSILSRSTRTEKR